MSQRAIFYRRVSTDEQVKNNSPSAQHTDGLAYADQHGMTVVDALLEDYTGTTVDRPAFNRLLELCDAGLVDAVIVQHPDRLGRGPILELAIALLANRGVEVHACNRGLISDEDDETSQIQNAVDGFVSGIERRNIRRRVSRGIVEKVTVEKKIPGGGTAPYGYTYVGTRKERTLIVCEEEAQHVRQMYEWYDSGVSAAEICNHLRAMRVPTPGVKHDVRRVPEDCYHWRRSTLYRILNHKINVGTFEAFRIKNPKKKALHATVVEVPVPAIVSPELFQRVQERLATGRALSRRNARHLYLLHCRARCGMCGSAIPSVSGRVHHYYRCTTMALPGDSRKHGTAPRFVSENVEYTAWRWIEENVLHEENLREGIKARNAGVTSERDRLQEEHDYYTQKLADNAKEAARLKQLYIAESYTLEEIAAEKKQLDEARAKLEADRAAVEQRIAGLGVSDDDARELLDTVRAIKEKAQNLSEEGKRKILDLCDATVTLSMRDGEPWMRIQVQLTLQAKEIPIVSQSIKD